VNASTDRRRGAAFGAVVCALLAAALLAGCSQPYLTDDRRQNGLVMVFTGIEGRSRLNMDICHGLDAGGVEQYAIELVDWTTRWPVAYVVNVRRQGRNRRKAAEIAEKIVKYQVRYPGRPVLLVGQSGGAAIALWAAEALPPYRQVDGIVLLAAALSPEYPLAEALRKSRRGIVSFHSRRDWVFLGAGTTLVGTMDGRHGSAAGRQGFAVPAEGPAAELYKEKLFQIAWHEQVYTSGYGGHLTSGSRPFVASHVAPFCLAETWNQPLVDRVLSGRAFWFGPGRSGGD